MSKAIIIRLPDGTDGLAPGSYLGLWGGPRVKLDNGVVLRTEESIRGINVRCTAHVSQDEKAAIAVSVVVACRTPEEWCRRKGFQILDPDGWRGANGRMWDDPITEREFDERASKSTVSNLKTFVKSAGKSFFSTHGSYLPPANQVPPPAPPKEQTTMTNDQCLDLIDQEVRRAETKHPSWNGVRHGESVIREEANEFRDAVFADEHEQAFQECVQLAAMCVRYMKHHAPSSVRAHF